jgi:hypothetical protein
MCTRTVRLVFLTLWCARLPLVVSVQSNNDHTCKTGVFSSGCGRSAASSLPGFNIIFTTGTWCWVDTTGGNFLSGYTCPSGATKHETGCWDWCGYKNVATGECHGSCIAASGCGLSSGTCAEKYKCEDYNGDDTGHCPASAPSTTKSCQATACTAGGDGGETWNKCADHGGTCNCNAKVRYGDAPSATWSLPRDASGGSISCSNTVFGDPKYGVAKTCECSATGGVAPPPVAPPPVAPPAATSCASRSSGQCGCCGEGSVYGCFEKCSPSSDPPPPPSTPAPPNLVLNVNMPYPKAEFDGNKQQNFKEALASAAGTSSANVDIVDISTITEEGRRQGNSITVGTKFSVADSAMLQALATQLKGPFPAVYLAKINAELKKKGLQASNGVSTPTATFTKAPDMKKCNKFGTWTNNFAVNGGQKRCEEAGCTWLTGNHSGGSCISGECRSGNLYSEENALFGKSLGMHTTSIVVIGLSLGCFCLFLFQVRIWYLASKKKAEYETKLRQRGEEDVVVDAQLVHSAGNAVKEEEGEKFEVHAYLSTIYLSIYLSICMYVCMCIYIYSDRETDTQTDILSETFQKHQSRYAALQFAR